MVLMICKTHPIDARAKIIEKNMKIPVMISFTFVFSILIFIVHSCYTHTHTSVRVQSVFMCIALYCNRVLHFFTML